MYTIKNMVTFLEKIFVKDPVFTSDMLRFKVTVLKIFVTHIK